MIIGKGKTEFEDELYWRLRMVDLSLTSFYSNYLNYLSSSLLELYGVWEAYFEGEVSLYSCAGRYMLVVASGSAGLAEVGSILSYWDSTFLNWTG